MKTRAFGLCFLALLGVGVGRSAAVQYSLEVANLTQPAFEYYIRGPIGGGSGELSMPGLASALRAGVVPAAAILYDRNLILADPSIARSFGTVPVRLTGASAGASAGGWQSKVSWDAPPGQRSIWAIQGATSHFQRVRHLAISATDGALRYYIPYRVSLYSRPQAALAFPLYFLQAGEGSETLWTRSVGPKVDLGRGIAAVVGWNTSAVLADWVYIVLEAPAEPAAFKIVVGWAPRGSANDEAITGAGVNGRAIRK